MGAPIVGITVYHLPAGRIQPWVGGAFAVQDTYVAALARAGARSVLLPFPTPDAADLDGIEGLLLVGGGDLDPARWGAEPHPRTYGVDPMRDEHELGLLRTAIANGVPTLAVCRGLQVLNVAMGGTLDQHLPDRGDVIAHGDTTAGAGASTHPVEVVAGTRLAATVGDVRIEACASEHHQGIERLGEGLMVSARSADGVIEAVEPISPSDPWLMGVQWHPERTAAVDHHHQDLFDGLVAAGRRSR